MVSTNSIYQQIAERTGGDIYLGVVGPVRTGKSTFVKRVMETLVIPHIENKYQKERAIDELPQSASGRTIMTSEPKFVPEEAVTITPDGTANLSVRLIDSVGYMIPCALGAEEEGQPRMITTPWCDEEIPMAKAAEIGTKRIMDDHCTIGIVMTTDGTIHDIPRDDFVNAERQAILDMKATNKPFIVLINSTDPKSEAAQRIQEEIEKEFMVGCFCVNCLTMEEDTIRQILSELLYEFPVSVINFYLPHWMFALSSKHPVKSEILNTIKNNIKSINKLSDCKQMFESIVKIENISNYNIETAELGRGELNCKLMCADDLFYQILQEVSGFSIENDAALIQLLPELAAIKKSYEKIEAALREVHNTGYGIVMPTPDEMHLEVPEIIRKGSNYGVRLKASAPSIHLLRADIETEINPIVGDEKQSQELLKFLVQEYEDNTEKLWESNIFGKSVYELVNEGLSNKLKKMPDEARYKLQSTLSRVINEDVNGLFCIIVA